ncbi:MAG: GtrA family protein [Betaproteobacteria bacterium]
MGLERTGTVPTGLARFALVGCVGFALDAGILTALVSLGFNVYASRAVSFTIAVLATWGLNRKWVFASGDGRQARGAGAEYLRYLLVQVVGALSNLGVFVAVLSIVPDLIRFPVIPLAIGAVAGFLVNFGGARFWVFARPAAR